MINELANKIVHGKPLSPKEIAMREGAAKEIETRLLARKATEPAQELSPESEVEELGDDVMDFLLGDFPVDREEANNKENENKIDKICPPKNAK